MDGERPNERHRRLRGAARVRREHTGRIANRAGDGLTKIALFCHFASNLFVISNKGFERARGRTERALAGQITTWEAGILR